MKMKSDRYESLTNIYNDFTDCAKNQGLNSNDGKGFVCKPP